MKIVVVKSTYSSEFLDFLLILFAFISYRFELIVGKIYVLVQRFALEVFLNIFIGFGIILCLLFFCFLLNSALFTLIFLIFSVSCP